jgi:hypothetical protein
MAHRDLQHLDRPPSLSGHCGHGRTCRLAMWQGERRSYSRQLGPGWSTVIVTGPNDELLTVRRSAAISERSCRATAPTAFVVLGGTRHRNIRSRAPTETTLPPRRASRRAPKRACGLDTLPRTETGSRGPGARSAYPESCRTQRRAQHTRASVPKAGTALFKARCRCACDLAHI